ncbi:MAG: leucine-rich repeat domain-containing protein [Salinivirgaceae bacterium]|nr:leucine-rich repeat domain-containing protein [Salinivirgaceae bacterium]
MECQESEGVNCKDCGSCAATDGGVLCTACDEAVCENCKMECAACGSPFCSDDMCGDCMEYCIECSVYCEDCGSCCGNGDDAYQCAECDRILCEDCVSECYECGSYYCNDCLNDACDAGCGICLECHESYEAFCEECGECLFVKERCNDHEYACAECHEEFLCPDCGQCYAEDGELCESCGLCADCAMSNEMHCPECEACYEDVGRCEDDGEHCRECCENNEWICEFCDHCAEAQGYDRCSDCGACEDCVSSYHLHCANCNTCLYSDYPNDSDRPEYCESCMPTEEGIPCLVCGERIEENGCTISGDGWHCDFHCVPCLFCHEVCFAENPDDACPDCGACSSCVAEHNLHCANCGTCMYAEYPNDSSRPELCDECAAAEGTPCNVCGQYITENGCTVSNEGWHCADHCQVCPECNEVCFAENTRCPLCGRCSNCCAGHEDVEATIIAEEFEDDEDLQEFLAEIEPIQDGIIYEGELGDSLDLTNYHGSNFSWIPTLFPNLKRFRCTSVAQLNALTDEQRANLEALYCPNIGLTELDLSKYPNLKILDCSGNNIDGFGSGKGSDISQLEYLNCSNNKLTALNASNWPNLKTLDCSKNLLTALNLGTLTNLESLTCGDNKFNSLDASGCTNLKSLDCKRTYYNRVAISYLNITGLSQLERLNYNGNNLTNLSIRSCAASLKALGCHSNNITSLNLDNCTNLESLDCGNNPIKTLNLTNCTKLNDLDFSRTQLETINLSGCTNLTVLNCSYNSQLTSLNLDNCTSLVSLDCNSNNLTELYLSGSENLTSLDCSYNNLTELNLSVFPNLTTLDCHDNSQLGTLDISQCSKLTSLSCGHNEDGITSLDMANYSNLTSFSCYSRLTELDLSGLTKLEDINLYDTKLTELDLSNYPNLKNVNINYLDDLKSFNISNCPKLESIYIYAYYCVSIIAKNNPALEEFVNDESESLAYADFSGCKNLSHLEICGVEDMTLDLTGCTNLQLFTLGCTGDFAVSNLESLQLSRFKKLRELNINVNELPCSFTFAKLFGIADANVSNVSGATKTGDKYIMDADAYNLSFNYSNKTSYIWFCGIKHTKTSNHRYTNYTAAPNNGRGSYQHEYDCSDCGHHTETVRFTKQDGVFLDVCGMKDDMSWVRNFTDLKGYRCDREEHLAALTNAQKQQLTELYVCNNFGRVSVNEYPNLITLSFSTYGFNQATGEYTYVYLNNSNKLENLSVCNNFNVVFTGQAVNLKNLCVKGNAYVEGLYVNSCTKLERVEVDIDELNLRNSPNLRYVDAPYGAVKFPEKAPLDTVILRGAIPCTPNPAVIEDFSYFDPNIDMSGVFNVKGATYNSEDQNWTIRKGTSAITYCYTDNRVHYIGIDYSHTSGKRTYSSIKSKIEGSFFGRGNDIGIYTCKYNCTECGKSITENKKFTTSNGIYLDVIGWTENDWNENKSKWISDYSNGIGSVKYDASTTWVMDMFYNGLKEIHIPNAGLSSLGGVRKFSDFHLRVLDCPGNNFETIELYSDRLKYLDCSNCNTKTLTLCGSTQQAQGKLLYLNCSENHGLISLDVSRQPYLETLICDEDWNLSSLDVINNPKLEKISCNSTALSSINVRNARELRYFSAEQTPLESLDIANNLKLEHLNCYCDDSEITELDLSQHLKLKYLYFGGNEALANTPVSHLTKLEYLDCTGVEYDNLDLSNMPNLETLFCSFCNLTELDLSHNPKLKVLMCYNNSLTELNLSNNSRLEKLDCEENQLTKLHLSSNSKISSLCCNKNQIAELDLSNCANLTKLYCGDNQIKNLKLYGGGKNMVSISCANNQLTNLDLSNCTGYTCNVLNNNLLYLNISKMRNMPSFYDPARYYRLGEQTRHIDTLPCTFRFADLAAGMNDANVYDYVGIEPYTDGKVQMWHVTATDGAITYYYNHGKTGVANVQHTLTFDEMSHKYVASKRYYTDTIPASYDAAGSCVMHTPCAYCTEEITETIVFDKLLYNVTVKDAREPGCAVEMGIGSEPASLSTLDGYNTKGNLINLKLDKGTEMQLKATAATGYRFVKWSDGNTDNPRKIVVNGDATYTAEFTNVYTIRVAAENGTITGAGEVAFGSTVTLTATANEGYHFKGWSDGNTDNPRTVIVNADMLPYINSPFTALFEQNAENQGGNNGGGNENQGGENGGENNGGNENQGGNNGGENNGGENNNQGTDVDETIAQAVKAYATGLTIHVENAVGDILLFDANGRALSRTTAADGEPVELHAPQAGVYIVRTAAGGVKVICNNY